ncbi:MAG: hypothetical protein IKJ27_00180 [Clostridia bacterium]|nr:hypothetical protein [Clostridia bacterium]
MAKTKRWTDKEDEYLIASIRSGKSLYEIGKDMKRSEKSLQARCLRLKIDVVEQKKKTKVSSFDLADIKCPFFDRLYRGKSVKCEGVSEGGYIVLGFESETGWAEHVRYFCNVEYTRCPIYKTLEEKYR